MAVLSQTFSLVEDIRTAIVLVWEQTERLVEEGFQSEKKYNILNSP